MENERQYELVLEEQRRILESVKQSGDTLDSKASTLLQSGSILIGAVALLNTIGLFPSSLSLGDQLALVVTGLGFLGVLVSFVQTYRPSWLSVPGVMGDDAWETMFQDYIHQDEAACFRQVLRDYQNSIGKLRKRNLKKSQWVEIGTYALLFMSVGLIIGALF